MKNLSIPKKLIVAFSTILIFFVVTIIFSVFIGTRTVTSSFDTFYSGPYAVTNVINNMRMQIQGIQKDMAYLAIDNSANDQIWLEDWEGRNVDFENSIAQAESLLESDAAIQKLQELKASWEQLKVIGDQFAQAFKKYNMTEAKRILLEEYYPTSLNVVDLTQQLIDIVDASATNYYNQAQGMALRSFIVSVALFVASLVLGILMCVYIIRSITKPLKEIETAAGMLADGNLNASITYQSKDELGSVAGASKPSSKRCGFIFLISPKSWARWQKETWICPLTPITKTTFCPSKNLWKTSSHPRTRPLPKSPLPQAR